VILGSAFEDLPIIKDCQMSEYRIVISPEYDAVIRKTLIMQLVVGCLAVLMLDGGVMARVVGVAMLGFWLSAAVLIVRRPMNPSTFDLNFIHWGFWFVLVIASFRQGIA
jgi:hypothetical protein